MLIAPNRGVSLIQCKICIIFWNFGKIGKLALS